MKPESFTFVIDTENYAGNFERDMTAYICGIVGDCGVGGDEARIFYKEEGRSLGMIDGMDKNLSDYEEADWKGIHSCMAEDFGNPFTFITQTSDDQGCFRPCAIHLTEGWFNNGLGECFKDGQEEEAILARIRHCLEESKKLPFNKELIAMDKKYDIENKKREQRWLTRSEETMKKSLAYLSVAIFMSKEPTEEQIDLLKRRAYKFAEYSANKKAETGPRKRREITITGFRLIKEITTTESKTL